MVPLRRKAHQRPAVWLVSAKIKISVLARRGQPVTFSEGRPPLAQAFFANRVDTWSSPPLTSEALRVTQTNHRHDAGRARAAASRELAG